jgi:hypothetical protein
VDRTVDPRAYWAAIAMNSGFLLAFALGAALPRQYHGAVLVTGIMGGQLASALISGNAGWGGNSTSSPSHRARTYWGRIAFLSGMAALGVVMLIWP